MKTITPQIRRAVPAVPTAPPAGIPSSFELQIDAVVFHGFSRTDSHRATTALQRELTRLITAAGVQDFSPIPSEHLDAGSIRASAVRPELNGARAACAIHGSLRA
jgi:hypothetical protein